MALGFALLSISQSFCGYLIVVATFERCLVVMKADFMRFVKNNRLVLVAFALVVGIVFQGTKFFEIEVSFKHGTSSVSSANTYHNTCSTMGMMNADTR